MVTISVPKNVQRMVDNRDYKITVLTLVNFSLLVDRHEDRKMVNQVATINFLRTTYYTISLDCIFKL